MYVYACVHLYDFIMYTMWVQVPLEACWQRIL